MPKAFAFGTRLVFSCVCSDDFMCLFANAPPPPPPLLLLLPLPPPLPPPLPLPLLTLTLTLLHCGLAKPPPRHSSSLP